MTDIILSSDYARLYFKKSQELQDVVNRTGLQVYWPELDETSSWREHWIAAGLAENIKNFTIDDFENLIRCIPEDNDSDQWQANVEKLYFKGPDLFGRFSTDDARWDAFIFILKYPPKPCWDVTVLDYRITRAKSILSYITPIRDESLVFLDRLRPLCFQSHSCAESKAHWRGWCCTDEKCKLWRNKALELQSAIVDFAEQHVPHDAIILPEGLTEMTRFCWNSYHAQPHLQSLQEMVASFKARKSEETGIQNGKSRGLKGFLTNEKLVKLSFTTALGRKELRQILRPEKWIILKVTTVLRRKELLRILRPEKLALPKLSAPGAKLDSLITGMVRTFCPVKHAPVPVVDALDIHVPSLKRQRFSSPSANYRTFIGQVAYQHYTDQNHSHTDRGQKARNIATENSSVLSVTRSPDTHYLPEYVKENEEIASSPRPSYYNSSTAFCSNAFQSINVRTGQQQSVISTLHCDNKPYSSSTLASGPSIELQLSHSELIMTEAVENQNLSTKFRSPLGVQAWDNEFCDAPGLVSNFSDCLPKASSPPLVESDYERGNFEKYECGYAGCSQRFTTVHERSMHRKNAHCICYLCPSTFLRPSDLFRHLNDFHRPEKLELYCSYCQKWKKILAG